MNARDDATALRLLKIILGWAAGAIPVLGAIAWAIWYGAHHLAAYAQTDEMAKANKVAIEEHDKAAVRLLHKLDNRLIRIEASMGIDPNHTKIPEAGP
jgi:3-methyladenine DNA glycosylase/8-oxoguanine DNA glycosylase